MASEVPPVLAEIILSGPEVVATERALAAVLERYGVSADNAALVVDSDLSDDLPAVHYRWQQQVQRLGSSSCGLSVDGLGLLVVSVPTRDVPKIIIALKSRLFDLTVDSNESDEASLGELKNMVAMLIVRFEGAT